MIELLQVVPVEHDDITHIVLGSGTILAMIGAGVSFGMLKSDTKNVKHTLSNYKQDLKNHQDEDNRKFESIGKDIGTIKDGITDIKVLLARESGRREAEEKRVNGIKL